jgi:hypothetical protein
MELGNNKRAILKLMEAARFNETDLEIVAVKSAPWLSGEIMLGRVKPSEYRAGPFSVHLLGGGTRHYSTIDAMLDEWIGD